MNEIGTLQYQIFLKNKKIYNRIKIRKHLIYIKIYTIFKVINGENWEYFDKHKLFLDKYLNDTKFFKNSITLIFSSNLPKNVKEEFPFDVKTHFGQKVYNYLVKNKTRITSSLNNYFSLEDYIRMFEALIEDEEQLKLDIIDLSSKIYNNFIEKKNIIPNLTEYTTQLIDNKKNIHSVIKSILHNNQENHNIDKKIRFNNNVEVCQI
jgi:hypothetical protein